MPGEIAEHDVHVTGRRVRRRPRAQETPAHCRVALLVQQHVVGIELVSQGGFQRARCQTTCGNGADERKGQAAGAKAWMVKPFKPDQMLMAVSKLCLP